jgi:hypothetical protein
MKSAAEIEHAFDLYLTAVDDCEKAGCYWALLHILVSVPDICASLDGQPQGGDCYVNWCRENFPAGGATQPGDRYQMRNALPHEGTTLPVNRTARQDQQTQYASFSYTDPRFADSSVHQLVSQDVVRHGANLTLNLGDLACETRQALKNWCLAVERNADRNARVERNLPRLAAIKPKEFPAPAPDGLPGIVTRNVTSST